MTTARATRAQLAQVMTVTVPHFIADSSLTSVAISAATAERGLQRSKQSGPRLICLQGTYAIYPELVSGRVLTQVGDCGSAYKPP